MIVQYNTTDTFPLNFQLRKINKGNVELLLLFRFSHSPILNDSGGQEAKKEITNDKRWVTERTEIKRKKR